MIDLTEPLNGRELEILQRIAKLDVHSVAAFTTELHRRGLV